MAIELYPHNQETYEKMTEMFKTSNRVGVVQPTGTGKSFLYLKWMEDHPQDRFAVLSPSTEIFTQLQEYAESSGYPELLNPVQMISYQALFRMTDDEIRDIRANKIVLDEFHRTGAEQWGPALQKLLDTNPHAQVLGASATPVRYLDGTKDMASELFDRKLAVEMSLGEAVRRNILPTPKYVPVWYDIDGKLERYERDISKIKNKEERQDLEDKLEQMKRRLENAYGAEDIFKKNMLHDHGKFIVFCRDVKHLEEMKKTVPRWMAVVNPNVRKYVSISAETDKDLQLQAFKDDNSGDSVKLLFTIDRLNEGVHVKGIDGVIMLRPTVSPIIYLQQMGRALVAGSEAPLIFDMVNNYQNVQVPFNDGLSQGNVFQVDFCGESISDIDEFEIFEDMKEFSSIFNSLESLLYLSYGERWEMYFNLYCSFVDEFGVVPSYNTVYNDFSLGNWCKWQRSEFKRGNLPKERYERLLSVGFVFDFFSYFWLNKLNLYISYKKEFGEEPNKNTVYQGEDLGSWCSHQRVKFRKDTLTEDQIKKLLDAGFSFDAVTLKREKEEQEWISTLDLYIEYCNEFNMPPIINTVYKGVALGNWCSYQRSEFNRGNLSDERYQMLVNAGFIFKIYDTRWQNGFDLYVVFKVEFGREPDSDTIYKGCKLGVWCQNQRNNFREGKLCAQRLKLLLDAGFVFDLRKYKEDLDWFSMLDRYVSYKKVFGCDPANSTIYKGEKLGAWCKRQRNYFHAGIISPDRLEKLNEAGFSFNYRKKGAPKRVDK